MSCKGFDIVPVTHYIRNWLYIENKINTTANSKAPCPVLIKIWHNMQTQRDNNFFILERKEVGPGTFNQKYFSYKQY